MKSRAIATMLFALFAFQGARLAAADSLRLETLVYVYRNSDFTEVKLPGAASAGGDDPIVFHAQATARFDNNTLALDGSDFTWSDDDPPAGFSRVDTPAIVLTPGKPVAMLSAAPLQYLEKQADGSFEVRNVAADSPDAPHCRLTFTVEPADGDATQFRLTCELELVTLTKREKIAGVSLDVGKPVLAKLGRKLGADLRIGDWSGIVAPAANGGDYGLFMLLRIVPAGTPVAQTGSMTPEQLDQFATYYYLNPQPGRIDEAIRAFGASGFAKDRGSVFIGFFGAVFAANPGRVAEWKRTISTLEEDSRACLHKALAKHLIDSLLDGKIHAIAKNDATWGAYFATGDTVYLRQLARELSLLDSDLLQEFWAGATAEWSLARNTPQHPAVLRFLQDFREDVDTPSQRRIDSVIAGNLDEIKKAIGETRKTRRFREPGSADAMNGLTWGTTSLGPVGAQAGDPKWGR